MLSSHQVRVHRAQACDLYLRVRSHPIIEHSEGLRFAPSAWDYPGQAALLQEAGLGGGAGGAEGDTGGGGQWAAVHDFGWLRAAQSPNWCVLPEEERLAPPPAVPLEGVTWEPLQ